MSDAVSSVSLLRSLRKLARGLSALFWGLPTALIVSVRTAKADWAPLWMFFLAVGMHASLLFGLWQMGAFSREVRLWQLALDRARLLALINLGLSPFLYWSNHAPGQEFFQIAVLVLGASALLFLFNLNSVIERLGALLPDETLREETSQFTAINRGLLLALLLLAVTYYCLLHLPKLPQNLRLFALLLGDYSLYALVLLVLLPLAMTMALLWKTKELILESIFSACPLPPQPTEQ